MHFFHNSSEREEVRQDGFSRVKAISIEGKQLIDDKTDSVEHKLLVAFGSYLAKTYTQIVGSTS